MRILGIDPGYKNAAAALIEAGSPILLKSLTSEGELNILDVRDFIKVMNPDVVVIENVHSSPKQGPASAFNFGWSKGVLCGVSTGLDCEVVLVTPQRWKAQFGLLKTEKDASRIKAIEEYPKFAKQLRYKKSVDLADALWIGLWYAETYK